MSFCETVWNEIAPLRSRILAQPFLAELTAGTLPRPTFQQYIFQDSLYLAEYARVLALAAARAPDAVARLEFSGGASVAVQVEQALHQTFFTQFGLDANALLHAEASPTCLNYTGYLTMLAATRSYEELIAGILPCFWIYWDVGCAVKPKSAAQNPYAAWIDTYADENFGAATARVKTIVDAAAAAATPLTRTAMAKAFTMASRFEYLFWDSAYRRESWAI
jgi:thiaminase (transcriptional activator TenA)